MAYLIQGTAQELAAIFDKEWMIVGCSDLQQGFAAIAKDLPRQSFWGTNEEAQYHLEQWRQSKAALNYAQGDMTGGNLYFFLDALSLFRKEEDSDENYSNNIKNIAFAYVNQNKECCGLMIFYRRDDPSQWLIGLSRNTVGSPQNKQITLLSSADLTFFVKKIKPQLNTTALLNVATSPTVRVVDRLNNPLLAELGADFLSQVVQFILREDAGCLDTKIERIESLLRFPQQQLPSAVSEVEYVEPKLLCSPNRALDVITSLKPPLALSRSLLLDCLAQPHGLSEAINAMVEQFTANDNINYSLIKMVVYFYEQEVLKQHADFLQDYLFKPCQGGVQWDDLQIHLTPMLLKQGYPAELIQRILAKKAYYKTVLYLFESGLSQNVRRHFNSPERLVTLDWIESNTHSDTARLCAIFWAKSTLTLAEYEQVLRATQQYPLLAKTLIALDQSGEKSVEDLKAIALNPNKHLPYTILYHFGSYLKKTNQNRLRELGSEALVLVTQAFSLFKTQELVDERFYAKVVENNARGTLLRTFLPQLLQVPNLKHRQKLIDLIYAGVDYGFTTLEKQAQTTQGQALRRTAMELSRRFICAQQMLLLGLPNQLMLFAASEEDEKATRFRTIILKVEEQCKRIDERIFATYRQGTKIGAWEKEKKEYRKCLYSTAYKALTESNYDFKPTLNAATQKVLSIVDPEIKSVAQEVLIAIANIIISVLSFGMANLIKYNATGMPWFFNHTKSGEELYSLSNDYSNVILTPSQ